MHLAEFVHEIWRGFTTGNPLQGSGASASPRVNQRANFVGKGHRSRDSSERSEVLCRETVTTLQKTGARNRCPALTLDIMNPPKPQRIVLAVLAIIVMLAWAIIAYVAIQVTETILLMLDYIVELAALT